jgi:succinate-semialdehyde dehydrogenase / glutarate-semialdehyde dehydrogenase
MYRVLDPATGELIETFPTATDAQVQDILTRSHEAYLGWRTTPPDERARLLRRAADVFEDRRADLAAIITQEMGKRAGEASVEIRIVCDIFRYYADNGADMVADEPVEIAGGRAVIQKRPVGSLIGIMPWNYPYYQVARFAAPNLMLGNTVVLKHAPNCPRSAAAIESVLREAGFPRDAYINVYATNEQIAAMLADPRVQGVSLTGSERAGSAVAAEAGRNLKKVVLELGGSDPLIILDSADLAQTVEEVVSARMGNMGQACNAPKRMIVMDDIFDAFVDGLSQRMSAFVAGDPADPETTLAPLSTQAGADGLVEQIRDAVDKGAILHTGGTHIDSPGSYVQPAVLTGVTPGMRAYSEELFGPAIVVYRVAGDAEAVELANDNAYGLGASVFSRDRERAQRVGDQLDVGMVYINACGGSQADLPFGGVKRSGFGRELGRLGIEEFMNKKVVVRKGADA